MSHKMFALSAADHAKLHLPHDFAAPPNGEAAGKAPGSLSHKTHTYCCFPNVKVNVV